MHNIQFNLSKAKEKVVYVVCRLVRAAEMNAKTLASLRFIFFCSFFVDCDSGHLAVWQRNRCYSRQEGESPAVALQRSPDQQTKFNRVPFIERAAYNGYTTHRSQ